MSDRPRNRLASEHSRLGDLAVHNLAATEGVDPIEHRDPLLREARLADPSRPVDRRSST